MEIMEFDSVLDPYICVSKDCIYRNIIDEEIHRIFQPILNWMKLLNFIVF